MNQPTFIVIGAAKCGTTSICDLLGAHPDVFMSSPKEPHHFSRLTTYDKQRDWYESLFPDPGAYQAVGEGSTSYTHPHRIDFVVPRIRERLPECRLIYMVRHPVRRLESDWRMRRWEERAPASITDAVDKQASLITLGLYWKHLQAYREAFPDDQLLVVFLEDFAEEPVSELHRAYEHIGVDPAFVPDDPETPRYASADFRRMGALAKWVRGVPGYDRLRDLVPDQVVRLARRTLTEDFDPSATWDPDVLETVRGYFRDDSRRLLQHCGKPEDYWRL